MGRWAWAVLPRRPPWRTNSGRYILSNHSTGPHNAMQHRMLRSRAANWQAAPRGNANSSRGIALPNLLLDGER